LLGIVLVVVLARAKPLRMPEAPPDSDELLSRFLAGNRVDEWNSNGDGEHLEVLPSATLPVDREPPDDP
jgi:hypothetical protein